MKIMIPVTMIPVTIAANKIINKHKGGLRAAFFIRRRCWIRGA